VQGEVHSARFSPTGALLASGSFDRLICEQVLFISNVIVMLFIVKDFELAPALFRPLERVWRMRELCRAQRPFWLYIGTEFLS